MSLTNPEKVVTEERLSEFYTAILPYLGGMPDILANKFSKGDLYSTDEKLIGRRDNGKPLYQRTYIVTAKADGTLFTFPETYEIYEFSGIVGGGEALNCSYDNSHYVFTSIDPANHLVYQKVAGYVGQIENVTLRFSKSTDSAVEIGSDTDYSTTEKIVGTWIDGKPVYQKTVSIMFGSDSTTGFVMSGNGIDKLIDYSGWFEGSSSFQLLPYINGTATIVVGKSKSSGNIYYQKDSQATGAGFPAFITLQYTKTT